MSKELAKETIGQLAERFDYRVEDYKKGNYNETQTRNDFINPFFEALGWDINNKSGQAEVHRDVIHEDKIKIGGKTKAPDYCFTNLGNKQFFLEAKKPSIDLKDQISPAYQLRRYGWSAKLPVSILTDFEEFAIYDCSIKPLPTDKASISRIKYLTFKDYVNEFDFLWDTFSKEMVLKGSFDKYVSANKGKKVTSGVDAEFLKSLDSWRDLLARNIVIRNPQITEDELNYSLQKIMDRIIFLRICEDRGVEKEEQLFNIIGNNTYQNIKNIFHQADQKYNSGLFDYKKDIITDNLNIDDKVLKTIIEEMYYPKSPYEFSVIPVEILGHSYEQYLGKVIKIDTKHKISIEEKPEVRKAGGVYYTPQYIVDYIVKNTVGKLVEGKTPEEVSKLKICDPACGSGSFLLGAYQYLLDWHLNYYTNADIKRKDKFINPYGNLTTQIKKAILLKNIYGVDIDTNAVEVTKLSLMLKAMEGETDATISNQLTLLHERVLPTLDNNIKSGNSLIDTDFYDNKIDFEPGAEKKIKPFNWVNNFPEVFKQGGFDVVIGNPPYFSLDIISLEQKNYVEAKYNQFATRQSNIYFFFMAVAHKILKDSGLLSFINERYYFNSKNALNFRKFLQMNYKIISIIDFKNIQIFANVNTLTVINSFEKSFENSNNHEISIIQFNDDIRNLSCNLIEDKSLANYFNMSQERLEYKDWNFGNPILYNLMNKFKNLLTLDRIVDMGQGLKSGLNEAFVVDKKIIQEFNLENELLKKYVKTRDIQRYNIYFRDLYLILTLNETEINHYPNILKYLNEFDHKLKERYQYKHDVCKWYSLSIPQNLQLFQNAKEKILTPLYSKGNKFGFDNCEISNNFYAFTDTFVLVKKGSIDISTKYILTLLNSTLLNFINKHFGKLKRDGYYEYSRNTLSKYPIVIPKSSNEMKNHDILVNLTDQMLQLNKDLQKATLPEQKEQLKGRIQYTDKKIDKLVYELYELTQDEIKIVEGE